MTSTLNVEWHQDSHKIALTLNKYSVEVSPLPCPKADVPGAACFHERVGCVVTWFLNLYGLDCNVGVAPAEPVMEIAWALIGPAYDIDACQLWVIPVVDEIYASWTFGLVKDE